MATAAQVGLAEDQFRNVTLIITAVMKREMPMKAAYISVATALVESGMRNIASANVPESRKSSHDVWPGSLDGLGHDHASCGMFQQQTGTRWTPAGFGDAMNQTTLNSPDGWGPPGVLMDPEKSTGLFLDALDKIKDWPNMQNWEAAQAVQHSKFADGSNYKEQDRRARSIVDALWEERDEFDMADLKDLDAIVRKYTDALHHDLQVILHGGVPDPKTGKVDVTHTRNLDSIFAELDAIKRKLH